MINEQERMNYFEKNNQMYIDQLKSEYDYCLQNENYALAKEYDMQIRQYKDMIMKTKTKQLKRVYSTEILLAKEEYDNKKGLLIEKWNMKADQLDLVVAQKEENLRIRHEMERDAFIESNQKCLYNTYSTRFYPMKKATKNNLPKEYLDLQKVQKMIFKGSHKDFEYAEHLKKLAKKALIEDSQKKMLQMKVETTNEYQKLMRRQETELSSLMCDIDNNVKLMKQLKEKEFEVLKKEYKNRCATLNKMERLEEVYISKGIHNTKNIKRYASVTIRHSMPIQEIKEQQYDDNTNRNQVYKKQDCREKDKDNSLKSTYESGFR